MIMVSENIQLRKKASDSFAQRVKMSVKCSFSSPQDLHGRNSKGPYNIISHDSRYTPLSLYSIGIYAVFQIYFIDIISDKGNNV